MTIDKQALHERYSEKPAPKCHICGAEMTVQRMSASRITFGCTGAIYDDTGCHYAEGRSLADDHYEQSRVTVVDVSDPGVLALLDELETAGKRISELECSETQLIGERDIAERALADMYEAGTGERPEWSNAFGFYDAVEEVRDNVDSWIRRSEKAEARIAERLPGVPGGK